MNKVLVTGGNGMLGTAIKRVVENNKFNDSYVFFDRNMLDITNRKQTEEIVKAIKPNYIINCAAYTNVNKAETDKENAHLINVDGVDNISYLSWVNGIKLIHISTDYVFDGKKSCKYFIDDKTNPINYYGETKRDGEISSLCYPNTIVIRTSWLYSDTHDCFLTKMLEKIKNKNSTKVVNDEFGQPTNVYDLAYFIVSSISDEKFKDKKGIFHFSNKGKTNWYEFAKKIEEYYNMFMLSDINVINECTSGEFQSEVNRPKNSVLDVSYTEKSFNIEIPKWKDSLFQIFIKMVTKQK